MIRFTLGATALALTLLFGLLWTRAETAPGLMPPAQEPRPPQVRTWMSTAPDGLRRLLFESGTTRVNPILNYQGDARNNPRTTYNVRLEVRDDPGVLLFKETRSFSSTITTTVSFTVTGEIAFNAYFNAAQTTGAELVQVITETQAMTRMSDIQSNVSNASGQALYLHKIIRSILGFPALAPDVINSLEAASTALEDVSADATAILDMIKANDSLANIQGRVNVMKGHADTAVAQIQSAKNAAGSGSGYAWPDSTGCHPYHTTVFLNDEVADAVEWMVGNPGPPDHFPSSDIVTNPKSIYAMSVTVPGVAHTATIQAVLVDRDCRPVTDGTPVVFSLKDPTFGSLSPISTTTMTLDDGRAGVITTTYTAPADIALGQHLAQVNFTSGNVQASAIVDVIGQPHTVSLQHGNNRYIRTGGVNVPIQATIKDINQSPVADGTQVTFRLDPPNRGSWSGSGTDTITLPTTDGNASATLRSGNTSGLVTITVSAGSAQATGDVVFVGLPANLQASANPSTLSIVSSPSLFTEISATVKTAEGLPAADGTQIDFIVDDPTRGTFDTGGLKTVSLRDGTAQAVLNLRPRPGTLAVIVQVRDQAVLDVVSITLTGNQLFLPDILRNFGRR